MEHRWSRRVAVGRNAIIECARQGIVFARMRDVSLHGARLITGALRLPRHTPLVLEFNLTQARRHLHFRLEAAVVRECGDGVAVVFLDVDRTTQQALRAALYETVPAEMQERRVA